MLYPITTLECDHQYTPLTIFQAYSHHMPILFPKCPIIFSVQLGYLGYIYDSLWYIKNIFNRYRFDDVDTCAHGFPLVFHWLSIGFHGCNGRCQPFTRTGHRRDVADPRCRALLRLVEALPCLKAPPKARMVIRLFSYIFIEFYWYSLI